MYKLIATFRSLQISQVSDKSVFSLIRLFTNQTEMLSDEDLLKTTVRIISSDQRVVATAFYRMNKNSRPSLVWTVVPKDVGYPTCWTYNLVADSTPVPATVQTPDLNRTHIKF